MDMGLLFCPFMEKMQQFGTKQAKNTAKPALLAFPFSGIRQQYREGGGADGESGPVEDKGRP